MRSLGLTLALLLLLAAPCYALVGVTVLDSGIVTSTNTYTTASVTAPAGQMLILYQGLSTTGCETGITVSGLGVTWTNRVRAASSTITSRAETAVSIGNTGTVTVTYSGSSGNCRATAYTLLALSGVNTSTADGVATTHSCAANGSCNNCTNSVTLGTYANANNLTVGGWTAENLTGTYTFTKDSDTGWVAGPTKDTGVIAGFATQWLAVKGSDTSADGTWTTPGSVNAICSTMEISASTVTRKRVRQD